MFKRVFKIILILLGIFLLILGIIWLIGRHTAQKNGATPLSFRQFLGLGTKQSPASTVPGEGSSTFTNNGTTGTNGSANGNGSGNSNGGNGNTLYGGQAFTTNTSQFTNNGNSLNGGANGGDNGNANNNIDNTSNQADVGTPGNNPSDTTNSLASCSDEDTNITFTPEEVAELNQLQNRFYAIAQTLHTDADVDTELANHDAFEVKAEQATELYNYCENTLPHITDPALQSHVSTPFWDAWTASDTPANIWNTSGRQDQDSPTYLYFDASTANHLEGVHDNNTDNPDSPNIKGPYGWLTYIRPQIVPINGSTVKYNTTTTASLFNPLHLPTPPGFTKQVPNGFKAPLGFTTNSNTNPPDYPLLMPVVEHILRINLW